jgi:hypothetical protein
VQVPLDLGVPDHPAVEVDRDLDALQLGEAEVTPFVAVGAEGADDLPE